MTDAYGRGAVTDQAPRCWRCSRLLALFLTRPWKMRCPRCKAVNQDGVKGPDGE
jgi:phage FluMu protein Com